MSSRGILGPFGALETHMRKERGFRTAISLARPVPSSHSTCSEAQRVPKPVWHPPPRLSPHLGLSPVSCLSSTPHCLWSTRTHGCSSFNAYLWPPRSPHCIPRSVSGTPSLVLDWHLHQEISEYLLNKLCWMGHCAECFTHLVYLFPPNL